jgi:hypothetical protein
MRRYNFPESSIPPMPSVADSFLILGTTRDGKVFRPSDWAERLCGIMSQFRPDSAGPQAHLSYSPYVIPSVRDEVRCVRVDGRLNEIEPLAYNFVVGFCDDNGLKTEPAV